MGKGVLQLNVQAKILRGCKRQQQDANDTMIILATIAAPLFSLYGP